jgi:hypothetical protein
VAPCFWVISDAIRSPKSQLLARFEELLASDTPQKRGYSFQDLVSELLSQNGFKVIDLDLRYYLRYYLLDPLTN